MSEWDPSAIVHLDRSIAPVAHTAMYVWHKFWSRKTWNVVGEYIKTYSPAGGVVLDPFAGSGVTAVEALRHGRRAIVCDLNPVATQIIRLTLEPVNLAHLRTAFRRVKERAAREISDLYLTECRKCGNRFPFTAAVWKNGQLIDIRYDKCPGCGDRREKDNSPTKWDLELIARVESEPIDYWYPRNPFYYPGGQPFLKKEKYESVDELYTRRNLRGLAILMHAIDSEPNQQLRDFLRIAFTSMSHLCTKMMPVGNPSESNHATYFSSPSWTQHSFWSAPHFMEQPVWARFESAVEGHQGLLRAKAESNAVLKGIRIGKSVDQVLANRADVCVLTGSCLDLLPRIPNESVEYVFTDPPYDASVQYGELAYPWACWLRKDANYLESMVSDEVVRNDRQEKDFSVYHSLLSRSFQEMFAVLRPDHFLTVTFHNPTFKVRNATIRAGTFSGFEFQKIHHQPLARTSAKSLMQPFGSAQGDFYLRFRRPLAGSKPSNPEEITEARFGSIVVESVTQLLAERAEPTPYTVIINYVDPILARNGFFSSLHTGLDVATVLRNHEGKEFRLVPARLGGAEGQLWWFQDPNQVLRLNEVPLSERVEQTVLRKLQERGKLTFTEVWDAVSTEFPNSLTTDQTSIKEALAAYAQQAPGGYWRLNPLNNVLESSHNELIALLAVVGRARGLDTWVGKKEQSEKVRLRGGLENKLSEFSTRASLALRNVDNIETVQYIDLLWISGQEVAAAFEVESTTSMTSGLLRGSNLPPHVPKYLVIPEERDGQLKRKMRSPLFEERFRADSWRVLYFSTLFDSYGKTKGNLDLEALVGKLKGYKPKRDSAKQMQLL